MDPKIIAKVRKSVAQLKQTAGRPRYSEFVKSTVNELLRNGMRPSELSNLTGIGQATLFSWSSSMRKNNFRNLTVSTGAPVSPSDLKIMLPSGVSVECSSMDALKSILEWLK